MRFTLGLLLFILTGTVCQSQDFPDAWAVSTQSASAIIKKDAQILELANYIMSHPVDPADSFRNDAMASVLLWMMSTPDYAFHIDETIVPMIKDNEEVLAIFMVSMTQFVLENPDLANNLDEVKLQAYTRMLDYYNNPQNKIIISKAIEQAIYAMRVGRLRKYLRIS